MEVFFQFRGQFSEKVYFQFRYHFSEKNSAIQSVSPDTDFIFSECYHLD